MPMQLLPREDNSSGETIYLENLVQEYKKGIPISGKKQLTQNLISVFYRTEKFDQVTESNIGVFEVNKVNIEPWRKISYNAKKK